MHVRTYMYMKVCVYIRACRLKSRDRGGDSKHETVAHCARARPSGIIRDGGKKNIITRLYN